MQVITRMGKLISVEDMEFPHGKPPPYFRIAVWEKAYWKIPPPPLEVDYLQLEFELSGRGRNVVFYDFVRVLR